MQYAVHYKAVTNISHVAGRILKRKYIKYQLHLVLPVLPLPTTTFTVRCQVDPSDDMFIDVHVRRLL